MESRAAAVCRDAPGAKGGLEDGSGNLWLPCAQQTPANA